MFDTAERRRRILIFGVLTLLSLLLVGAVKMEIAMAAEAEAAEQTARGEVLAQASQIPAKQRPEWRRVARQKPMLMLRASTARVISND